MNAEYKHIIKKRLQAVKAEIARLDRWLDYNNIADEVYFKKLRRKRELLLKKQQLNDRLNPKPFSGILPDIQIISNNP